MSLPWRYQLVIEEIEEETGRDFDTLSFTEQDIILEEALEKKRHDTRNKS